MCLFQAMFKHHPDQYALWQYHWRELGLCSQIQTISAHLDTCVLCRWREKQFANSAPPLWNQCELEKVTKLISQTRLERPETET